MTEDPYQIARVNFAAFCTAVNQNYELPPHLTRLAIALEDVSTGKSDRLMVSMPPRHGKTMMCSQTFSAWYIGNNPGEDIIIATYGQKLTKRISRVLRDVMRNPVYKCIFPDIELDADNQSVYEMSYRCKRTGASGNILATSIGSAMTGHGAGLAIIDDAYKDRSEAESEAVIESTNEWYDSALYTRLSPTGKVLLVGTRWSIYDLHAHAEEGEKWDKINMPALSEFGDALWPSRFPADRLRAIREVMGHYDFDALYQGNPLPKEGGLLKPHLVNFYEEKPQFDRIIICADTAIKTGKTNDYSVAIIAGLSGNSIFLIDMWRDRVEYPVLKKILIRLNEMYRPDMIHVEDKASGQQVLQELSAILPLQPLKAIGDKVQRAQSLADCIMSGRFYVPKGAPWWGVMESEFRGFPTAKHDDVVDSASYLVAELNTVTAFRFFDRVPYEEHPSNPPSGWPIYRSAGYEHGESVCLWWTVAKDDTSYDGNKYAPGTVIIIDYIQTARSLTDLPIALKSHERDNGYNNTQEGVFWTPSGKMDLMVISPGLYDLFLPPTEEIGNSMERLRFRLNDGKIVISSRARFLYRTILGCAKDPMHPEKIRDTKDTAGIHVLAMVASSLEGELDYDIPIEKRFGDDFREFLEIFTKR